MLLFFKAVQLFAAEFQPDSFYSHPNPPPPPPPPLPQRLEEMNIQVSNLLCCPGRTEDTVLVNPAEVRSTRGVSGKAFTLLTKSVIGVVASLSPLHIWKADVWRPSWIEESFCQVKKEVQSGGLIQLCEMIRLFYKIYFLTLVGGSVVWSIVLYIKMWWVRFPVGMCTGGNWLMMFLPHINVSVCLSVCLSPPDPLSLSQKSIMYP